MTIIHEVQECFKMQQHIIHQLGFLALRIVTFSFGKIEVFEWNVLITFRAECFQNLNIFLSDMIVFYFTEFPYFFISLRDLAKQLMVDISIDMTTAIKVLTMKRCEHVNTYTGINCKSY